MKGLPVPVMIEPHATPPPPTPLGSLAWRRWHASIPVRLREFTTLTFPGLPELWYSDAALDRVQANYHNIFPTMESVTAREKHSTTDLFVTWVGSVYVARCPQMVWYSHPHAASNVYVGFGPALRHNTDDSKSTYVIELLEWAAADGFDLVRATLWGDGYL
jgi:hypothetical protein